MQTMGVRIRDIREEKGYTLEKLAGKAGVSKSFLWEVEQDKTGISGERLLRLANALGASLDFLLRGEPAPKDYTPPTIDIPWELSEVAEERGLSHRETVALLEVQRSLVARRSSNSRTAVTKQDWRDLHDGVRQFLEDKS